MPRLRGTLESPSTTGGRHGGAPPSNVPATTLVVMAEGDSTPRAMRGHRVPRQIHVNVYRRSASGATHWLLLRRIPPKGGFWQAVTGAPEPGETDAAAARREVIEETALDAPVTPLDYRYNLHDDPRSHDDWAALYGPGVVEVPEECYLARAPRGFEPTIAPDEHDAFRWCSVVEALHLLVFDGNREALRRASVLAETLRP